jgi:hypothetical protein
MFIRVDLLPVLLLLGHSSQTWAAGVSGGLSLCDAGLNQKFVMNNVTGKREDARAVTRAGLLKAVYGCGPSFRARRPERCSMRFSRRLQRRS